MRKFPCSTRYNTWSTLHNIAIEEMPCTSCRVSCTACELPYRNYIAFFNQRSLQKSLFLTGRNTVKVRIKNTTFRFYTKKCNKLFFYTPDFCILVLYLRNGASHLKLKQRSFRHKLKFSRPYIFGTKV